MTRQAVTIGFLGGFTTLHPLVLKRLPLSRGKWGYAGLDIVFGRALSGGLWMGQLITLQVVRE